MIVHKKLTITNLNASCTLKVPERSLAQIKIETNAAPVHRLSSQLPEDPIRDPGATNTTTVVAAAAASQASGFWREKDHPPTGQIPHLSSPAMKKQVNM